MSALAETLFLSPFLRVFCFAPVCSDLREGLSTSEHLARCLPCARDTQGRMRAPSHHLRPAGRAPFFLALKIDFFRMTNLDLLVVAASTKPESRKRERESSDHETDGPVTDCCPRGNVRTRIEFRTQRSTYTYPINNRFDHSKFAKKRSVVTRVHATAQLGSWGFDFAPGKYDCCAHCSCCVRFEVCVDGKEGAGADPMSAFENAGVSITSSQAWKAFPSK